MKQNELTKEQCREIIDLLHLEQKVYDGYYFNPDGELVCFDASLSGICDGLLIRKDYLEQFLVATGLKLFWLCTGEKQFFRGKHSQIWKRWEGFVHYGQNGVCGNLKPIKETIAIIKNTNNNQKRRTNGSSPAEKYKREPSGWRHGEGPDCGFSSCEGWLSSWTTFSQLG